MSEPQPQSSGRRWKRLAIACLKWGIFGLVLAFVGRQVGGLWRDLQAHPVVLDLRWLALGVGLSILAWIPSIWYWRRLMTAFGNHVTWWHTARAYYAGHLGKYAPGKALVLIIRTTMLKGQGASVPVAASTVGYESLAYMAAGAVLGVMLVPWVFTAENAPRWARFLQSPFWRYGVPLLVFVGALAGMALLSDLFTRIVKYSGRKNTAAPEQTLRLSRRDCLVGLVPLMGAWAVHGLVLGLTIQSFSDRPFSIQDWPLWTLATAVAMLGGFAMVFVPGGLGVREALYIDVLAPHLGQTHAVLAALLMRLVCILGEVVATVVLYFVVRPVGMVSSESKANPPLNEEGTTEPQRTE